MRFDDVLRLALPVVLSSSWKYIAAWTQGGLIHWRVASELAETSACLDSGTRSHLGRSDLLTIEVRHEASIASANKLARAAEGVDLTCTAEVLLARRGGSGVLDGENATSSRGILDRRFHAGEYIALSENLSAS